MSTCAYCKTIKEELKKNNIDFVEKLTSDWAEEWDQVVGLASMPTTPIIHYKENYFIPGRDFGSPDNLVNILKNFKESKFSESRQALEKIKTLNYNTATAFTRLDTLIRQIEKNYRELFEDEETKTE